MANNIRFTAGAFHFIERPEFFTLFWGQLLFIAGDVVHTFASSASANFSIVAKGISPITLNIRRNRVIYSGLDDCLDALTHDDFRCVPLGGGAPTFLPERLSIRKMRWLSSTKRCARPSLGRRGKLAGILKSSVRVEVDGRFVTVSNKVPTELDLLTTSSKDLSFAPPAY